MISVSDYPSDGKDVQDIDKFPVYRFGDADCLVERDIYDLVILDSDHDVALAVLESFDCSHAKPAGEDTVLGCRASSPLEMA